MHFNFKENTENGEGAIDDKKKGQYLTNFFSLF